MNREQDFIINLQYLIQRKEEKNRTVGGQKYLDKPMKTSDDVRGLTESQYEINL